MEGTVMRKGPWTAEEDEILMEYVKKHGPRDWSSIRSKGMLPRTGKSCRLRWVNKLKPDLKTGCKFSAEEERVVIELQAQFGNRWARIATYLPGRTDNDVKNFWSTRQKRLARILQTSNQPKSQKTNGKIRQLTPVVAPRLSPIQMQHEASCSRNMSCQTPYMENSEVIKMMPVPEMTNPPLRTLEPNPPQLEFAPLERKARIEPQPEFSFPQLPQPLLDLPLLPEVQDLVPDLGDTSNLIDMFGNQGTCESDHGSSYTASMSFPGIMSSGRNGGKGDIDNLGTPDSFFDDFPADMFDYIEPLPSSSER